jgi:hypothetical protein
METDGGRHFGIQAGLYAVGRGRTVAQFEASNMISRFRLVLLRRSAW